MIPMNGPGRRMGAMQIRPIFSWSQKWTDIPFLLLAFTLQASVWFKRVRVYNQHRIGDNTCVR